MPPPLRAAVIGCGHLGKEHARIIASLAAESEGVLLHAVCDPDPARRGPVAVRTGARSIADYRSVLSQVDLATIVVPTSLHTEVAAACLDAGVHVLVEKPMTRTLAEAEALCALARARGRVLQVGHIERFNPAIRAVKERIRDPRYVVCERLSPFAFRSMDVGVVFDLMIHDLDLLQFLVPSAVARIDAVGIPVISRSEDIANARIVFENGCIASLNASRVSAKRMRKVRLFQRDRYISMDFDQKNVLMYRRSDEVESGAFDPASIDPRTEEDLYGLVFGRLLHVETQSMDRAEEPLRAELRSFVRAVRDGTEPEVPGEDGRRAIALAEQIAHSIAAYVRAEAERRGEKPPPAPAV